MGTLRSKTVNVSKHIKNFYYKIAFFENVLKHFVVLKDVKR